MGAATTMMATGEKLPENVKAAIEDCGYTSAWDILGIRLTKSIKLPRFPFLYSANIVNLLRENFNLRNASSVNRLRKALRLLCSFTVKPIPLFHMKCSTRFILLPLAKRKCCLFPMLLTQEAFVLIRNFIGKL